MSQQTKQSRQTKARKDRQKLARRQIVKAQKLSVPAFRYPNRMIEREAEMANIETIMRVLGLN